MSLPAAVLALPLAVAVGAWVFAVRAGFRAWRIAESHPPYRALGLGRYVNWMGSLRHMPPEAQPYVRQLRWAAIAFAAAILSLAVLAVVLTAPPR